MRSLLKPMRSRLLATPAIVHMDVYANTLTDLIPSLYAGVGVVSRELVGFIPSVTRNADMERAAVGQSVRYELPPAVDVFDVTPAMQTPEPTDRTIPSGTMTITKSKGVNFGVIGEEQRGLNNGGPGWQSTQALLFAQGLRTLVNLIETDLAVEAAANASRAYGTAGTTPFASDLSESAQIRKILDDNGAPPSDRSLIIDTSAGAKLRTLSNLTKVNEAGTTMTLRQGEMLDIHGHSIKESAAVVQAVKGTAAGATTNTAGYAVGATTITLASVGTGTIKAGDVITFAGDANKYCVVSGDTDVSNGGTITIGNPGIRVAIPAAATGITVLNNHAANILFSASALHLAVRPPALPDGGDSAVDSMMIVDPRSGLVFEVRVYAGYRKMRYEVTTAWGVKATQSEHIAMLLG